MDGTYFLQAPLYLKQVYKGLEAYLFSPLYSNHSRALEPIFRRCQRSSVVFPDNEQDLFPGPNHPRQRSQNREVRFGTSRSFHLSTEDDKRLSQERVLRHELGSETARSRRCDWVFSKVLFGSRMPQVASTTLRQEVTLSFNETFSLSSLAMRSRKIRSHHLLTVRLNLDAITRFC